MPLGPRGPPLRGPLESLGTHGTHMPVAVFYLSTSRRRLVISKSCHANALLARSLDHSFGEIGQAMSGLHSVSILVQSAAIEATSSKLIIGSIEL